MSQSTSDASNCIVMVNLQDLNKPEKLCKWIRILAYYKTQYLQIISNQDDIKQDNNKIDNDDIEICNELSKFMYSNQLTGYNFIHGFTKTDFENVINIINDSTNNESKYSIDKFEWIWDCIQHSKTNTHTNINNNKLQWINNSWTQFEMFDNSEIVNHKLEQKSIEFKQEYNTETETQTENKSKSDNNKNETKSDNKQNKNMIEKIENNTKKYVENETKLDYHNELNIVVNNNTNDKIIENNVIHEQKHLENQSNDNDKSIESHRIENNENAIDIVNGTDKQNDEKNNGNRPRDRSSIIMAQDDVENHLNQCTVCGCCIL